MAKKITNTKSIGDNQSPQLPQRTCPLKVASATEGGELGIRTPGPVTVNSFQDCRNRPLCHLSGAKIHPQAYQPKKYKKEYLI